MQQQLQQQHQSQLHCSHKQQRQRVSGRPSHQAQAVLDRSAAAAAAQAFHVGLHADPDERQQQRQQQMWQNSDALLHPQLLQRPRRGVLQLQQQQQQEGEGALLHSHTNTPGSFYGSPVQEDHEVAAARVQEQIAAASTVQQLQQLFPLVAAAGKPSLTTLLLLQAVRVVRNSSGAANTAVGSGADSSSSSGRASAPSALGVEHRVTARVADTLPSEQQQQQQQQQQPRPAADPEVRLLLKSVDRLLLAQVHQLQFQHISGVLWAWSQLRWRQGRGQGAGIGLGQLLARLLECPVALEQAGYYQQVGPQLARAVQGCAALNVKNPHVWSRLLSITQGSAALLEPRELALVAWGLAHNGTPQNPAALAAWSALLQRAQGFLQLVKKSHSNGSSHFDRVGALNLSWAMVAAGVSHLAPAGMLKALMQLALGPEYSTRGQQQQQQHQQQVLQEQVCDQQGQGQQQQEQQEQQQGQQQGQQQQQEHQQSSPERGLMPQEVCCLIWTLATVSTQQQRLLDAHRDHKRQPLQQQATQVAAAAAATTPRSRLLQQQQQQQPQGQQGEQQVRLTAQQVQQLQEMQQRWAESVQDLLQDLQLHQCLAAAAVEQLPQLQPSQLAQLALAAATLAAHDVAAGAEADSSGGTSSEHSTEGGSRAQLWADVVRQVWIRILQISPEGSSCLHEYDLKDVAALLQSITAVLQQQQQQQEWQQQEWQHCQQQQQGDACMLAALVTAAAERILCAGAVEQLPPRTAVVLLHQFAALSRATAAAAGASDSVFNSSSSIGSSSSSDSWPACVHPAAAAVCVRLVRDLCAPGAIGQLRDRELVLAATAAGQLAALQPASVAGFAAAAAAGGGSAGSSFDHTHSSRQARALRLLLQQLALPLAAVAPGLKLRSLANVACAYAAVGVAPEELFRAVSDAVQRPKVLGQGSSWALARTLGACAAVGYVDEGLCAAVAEVLCERLRSQRQRPLAPRVLSKLAGALAAVGYDDRETFRDIAGAVVAAAAATNLDMSGAHKPAAAHNTAGAAAAAAQAPILPGYQPRDVGTLAWALATAGLKDAKPYQALAAAGVQLLPAMSCSHLANLLWGCATAGVLHEPLMAAVVEHLVGTPSFTQKHQQGQLQEGQLQQQQEQLQQRGQQQHGQQWQQRQHEQLQGQLQHGHAFAGASASDVATIAWSFAKLQVCEPQLLLAPAQHFILQLQQYGPADAADLAWALAWHLLGGQQSLQLTTASGAKLQREQQQQTEQQQQQHQHQLDLKDVVQQLLEISLSDAEQLTPQQLADLCLLDAAVQAGCVGESSMAQHSAAQHSADSGGSSSSSGGGAGGQALWEHVTFWGPSAFSAADGAKLLWASLLTAPQQQLLQQQQQQSQQQWQQEREDLGSIASTALLPGRLLAAGARALIHDTAAVCSSSFAQEVLGALQASSLQAHTCIPQQGQQQQQQQHKPRTRKASGTAAATAAAMTAATAAAAAAVASAVLAACGPGPASTSNSSSANSSSSSVLQQLAPEVLAQLLGHIVVTPVGQQEPQQHQQHAVVPVLLCLVPNEHLCRSVTPAAAGTQTDDSSSSSSSGTAQQQQQLQQVVQLGWRAAVAAQVLMRQRHFAAVVLTQQQWEAWGEEGVRVARLQEIVAEAGAAAAGLYDIL